MPMANHEITGECGLACFIRQSRRIVVLACGTVHHLWVEPSKHPSLFTSNEILMHMSMYYLSETFDSTAFIYARNPDGFSHTHRTAGSNYPPFVFYLSAKHVVLLREAGGNSW
ncbi:hypothetical protein V8C37DRAFT_377493 [Trichoderma ceciliae]